MELISPGIGLMFWMVLAFSAVVFILGKYAWKPIMASIKEREKSIEDALSAAERAKEEMKSLIFSNEKMKKEAIAERDALLTEARKIRDSIIEEARVKAKEEYVKIVENAKESINYEKLAAITDLKNQIAQLSIEIAEKILKQELSPETKQQEYIKKLVEEININ
ncbi:MAG: F0F1 ATP synthase subunit B [Bacteroidales bacterium]|nr:F0F1 ATP synthase subunit B [Bacteroidales bacterium]